MQESADRVYWIESRPQAQGRYAIMERFGEETREVLPKALSARSMVQELGGGSFELDQNGMIVFSDKLDRNVYRLDPTSGEAAVILRSAPDTCYADFACHPVQDHWIMAIKEDSHEATPETQADSVHNSLIAIDTRKGAEHEIAAGDDFYAYPRFSPDGTRICWVQWSHPDMPWTGTRLYVADWQDGKIGNPRKIAGEKLNESISQPRWSPDGTLYFASDHSGYWQLCSYEEKSKTVRALCFEGLMKSELAIADWLLAR